MKIQVNDVYVADNVSHGTQIIKKDYCEITLVHYDGYVETITVSKDARVDVESNLSEKGEIVTIKSTEQQLKEQQEENNQLKEEVKTLKETMIEVINSIYEEGQV